MQSLPVESLQDPRTTWLKHYAYYHNGGLHRTDSRDDPPYYPSLTHAFPPAAFIGQCPGDVTRPPAASGNYHVPGASSQHPPWPFYVQYYGANGCPVDQLPYRPHPAADRCALVTCPSPVVDRCVVSCSSTSTSSIVANNPFPAARGRSNDVRVTSSHSECCCPASHAARGVVTKANDVTETSFEQVPEPGDASVDPTVQTSCADNSNKSSSKLKNQNRGKTQLG